MSVNLPEVLQAESDKIWDNRHPNRSILAVGGDNVGVPEPIKIPPEESDILDGVVYVLAVQGILYN